MAKTITANIPARKQVSKQTCKVFSFAGYTAKFEQDDAGQWTAITDFGPQKVTEADVIADCRNAINWQEIKQAHFPMFGFHN